MDLRGPARSRFAHVRAVVMILFDSTMQCRDECLRYVQMTSVPDGGRLSPRRGSPAMAQR